MTDKVNVLGTDYKIIVHKVSEDKELKDNHWSGYCNSVTKAIVVADLTEKEHFELDEEEQALTVKLILRHEINHAFFNESGLEGSALMYEGAWVHNEEMIDWFALQAPKIFRAYTEAEAL